MDLLLDAGNTRLKWGLWGAAGWHGQGAIALAALDELAGVLAAAGPVRRVLGANVAGAEVAARLAGLLAARSLEPEWIRPVESAFGVHNRYLDPSRLGADRWAALIGARALHGAAALVVTSGTATTADVLDGAGVFQGGVILPGLDLMRSSLARDTAQLPLADGRFEPLPRRTVDAIVSGCLHAQLGAQRHHRGVDLGQRGRAVLGRVALAEHVQVYAVQHKKSHEGLAFDWLTGLLPQSCLKSAPRFWRQALPCPKAKLCIALSKKHL